MEACDSTVKNNMI